MLKPLLRRPQQLANQSALVDALSQLDGRALGEVLLGQLRDVLLIARKDEPTKSWREPARAAQMVALAKALYAARRISRQEYVIFAVSPVEDVHEERWLQGNYESELDHISEAMRAIEEEHGLEPDDYWPLGEGPEEHGRLNEQYGAILDAKLLQTLREFGLDDLADLSEHNSVEFQRLRERGRRIVFHRNEHVPAVRDIVVRYEHDAQRAASANAWSAAVTSLSAGLEGLLLLRCLGSPQKACRIASKLPRRRRPKYPDDPTTWSFENLIETCLAAGWLPPIETSVAQYDAAGLAHLLRRMRNYVHPGKQARERPWVETDAQQYQDVHDIYVVLLSTLGKVRRGKRDIGP